MFRLLPWKMIVRRAARAHGISDPALWLARLRSFSQPSEVQEPIELLRAGIHFHARGLINTKAIQHNLDWVWPYWVERQFDPADDSFVPRAFSFSHINLTHRNWTAVGQPGMSLYPIVDPRGLVTPLHDGWSIDFWLTDPEGHRLIPSRAHDDDADQSLICDDNLAVQTTLWESDLRLRQKTEVVMENGQPVLKVSVSATSTTGGSVAMTIRPYNPEGVQFVDSVASLPGRTGWTVNEETQVLTDRAADRLLTSHYDEGDVLHRMQSGDDSGVVEAVREVCDQGMATAASVFDFRDEAFELTVRVPLNAELKSQASSSHVADLSKWTNISAESASLSVPDFRIQRLYESAVRTLVLLSADEVVPGPYTYRRFWFRDACLMMNPLMAIGFTDRCRRMLEKFPARQLSSGYFRSQEGEWDSNGQVLWILNRFRRLTQAPLPDALYHTLDRAVKWIDKKRTSATCGERHAGLLPAGFSAEHLGPNDYYYWDDFWAEAGLRAAAEIWTEGGDRDKATRALSTADELHQAIELSLKDLPAGRTQGGIPASPYRRMDAGAIGSLVADYPLQLTAPGDERIMATVKALIDRHFYRGGFMQDMIHSGINAYLTLDIAQTLLRSGDDRWRNLVDAVADLASPTGQWPEAIHPRTLGGCMGDGQHGWAAAEWIMMMRSCFVREEHDRLIIGSGLYREWFRQDADLAFGPTLTPWGKVSIRVVTPQSKPMVIVDAHWHSSEPRVDICIPGFVPVESIDHRSSVSLKPLPSEEFRVNRSEPLSVEGA